VEVLNWFRAYVEQLLAQTWEACRVEADSDGDYLFRHGAAAGFARVEPGPPMGVRVVAQAAVGVRRTAKLLNELNAHARSVSTYWFDGAVYVDKALDAGGVTAETLSQACTEVGTAADGIGALVAAMFDGQTPFAPSPVDEESA
jgi:hypothetical protein